jgi:hypothetical protein
MNNTKNKELENEIIKEKFILNIDTDNLDEILLEIDKDIENPTKWVDFEECFDRLEKRLYEKRL